MRSTLHALTVLLFASGLAPLAVQAETPAPLEPFRRDEHTLLLYHFDEGSGDVAKDAGRFAYDGQIRHATWGTGRFGGALEFNGKDSSVFREATPAIEKLKQLTVECWYRQERPADRQFLAGKDVTFHFDLSGGVGTSLSLYNQDIRDGDPQNRRHQHLGTALRDVRLGRWHHLAATYDGSTISFFLDGALQKRLPAEKDYSLGGASRGLWVGCYVGNDFWYSGKIDELRISDCVRYDPEGRLAEGQAAFAFPSKTPVKAVRVANTTGSATLAIALRPRYGGPAGGWVYLKPPGKKACIVGRFELPVTSGAQPIAIEYDVSDECASDGRYAVALESAPGAGYCTLTEARLERNGQQIAHWSGELSLRRTFNPPLLIPLAVGASQSPGQPGRLLLLPQDADRCDGQLEIDAEPGEAPLLAGHGAAEYWIDVPVEQAYRLYLRYAAPARRPCDVVIDGTDLHPYNMCARNLTETALSRDALWEYQGAVELGAGLHWVRVQGVLPDILGIRLEPVASVVRPAMPWQRYDAPIDRFLCSVRQWESEPLHGGATNAQAIVDEQDGHYTVRFSTSFTNVDPQELSAGDAVRFLARGQWDLEPFGRVSFRWTGQGSGHVASLWAVDLKGDEKLLWRARDRRQGREEVSVPLSFEGNDVFDPGRVVALAWELDEASCNAEAPSTAVVVIEDPVFHRRDALEMTHAAPAESARAAGASRVAPLVARDFRPWTKPVVPEEHLLWATTEPKPVTRKTLGYGLHLTGARSISPETLDDFHKFYHFGDVCWPHIGMCPQRKLIANPDAYRAALTEFERQLVGVRDRDLLLFDVWGYVPFEKDFPWTIAPEHQEILLRVFGDRFLGYDNGEQDGRYIGSYAEKGTHTDRREGWADFVRWDEHVCGDSMNYMNATGSLNFSHYYGQRNCRLLGLETAQGLPSDTLMFAFLRGAGRQYGRLTYQASSIWNRFGYNMYHDRQTNGAEGYGFGPNKGCSLSLHKRLFFAGYLGGQSIFGTETAQFTGDRLESGAPELSPLGRQHLESGEWAARHPDRGVPYTPVAFVLDFHHGWNPPRHLYRGDKYKIWGKFPYEKGDYLIDGLFRMVWPGYEDCSYLRNERGFLTPTPYGDIFDVITNVCHPQILQQYAALMLSGQVEMTPETINNLSDYVRAGGDLILDAQQAGALPQELTGVGLGSQASGMQTVDLATGRVADEQPYHYTVLACRGATPLLVSEQGHPLMTVHAAGKGRVIVGAIDCWMTDMLKYREPEIVNLEPPYQLLSGVREVLGRYFDSFSPVTISPAGLGVMTTCFDGDENHLWVGLLNNDLFADWHGQLQIRQGMVLSAQELRSERPLPASDRLELTIPAGDVAIIDLRLK